MSDASAPHGYCLHCSTTPYTRIYFKSHKWFQRVHFICLKCEPNWLEEAIEERDRESDSDSDESEDESEDEDEDEPETANCSG